MSSDDKLFKIVPAQLNFLAIYNPQLGGTEETEKHQVLFYYSKSSQEQARKKSESQSKRQQGIQNVGDDEENERMRQIGLAQGMVAFARNFSNGKPIDSVENEKHRIVIYELEPSWWILASIDLTRIPNNRSPPIKDGDRSSSVEYSAREVSPPALLLQQLIQAHRNLQRSRFCDILHKFWTKFALNWDVLLHGNPSADIYGGVKLAAGGELGIGVGEEDWGSGEREVLEGLVRGTDGLVDLTLSRYGGSENMSHPNSVAKVSEPSPSLGARHDPGPDDGLIFPGLGALSRSGLQSLTDWIRCIYIQGEDAYGVGDNPTSTRKKRRRKKPTDAGDVPPTSEHQQAQEISLTTEQVSPLKTPTTARAAIPPPIVSAAELSLKAATEAYEEENPTKVVQVSSSPGEDGSTQPWVKYLTLGYGSVWGPSFKASEPAAANQTSQVGQNKKSEKPENVRNNSQKNTSVGQQRTSKAKTLTKRSKSQKSGTGHFIIGLRGDLDDDSQRKDLDDDDSDQLIEHEDGSSRLSLRTLYIRAIENIPWNNDDIGQYYEYQANETTTKIRRFRVVVYVHHPFIYTLLFDPNTYSLALPSFYHDLHHHLTPLHGPLLRSTSPENVARRLRSVLSADPSPVFDIVHSPQTLATRCSLPNIPDPSSAINASTIGFTSSTTSALASTPWSRAEALNVHSQILQTYIETRRRRGERERTMKTGKGWWIVWMDIATSGTKSVEEPSSSAGASQADDEDNDMHCEAILVRKAQDRAPVKSSWMGGGSATSSLRSHKDSTGSALGRLIGRESSDAGKDASVAAGPGSSGRLTEGLGLSLDPKKYVEVLLSLNR